MEIGEKIKQKRLDLGYSQEELAKLLNYRSETTIHKIEIGKINLNSKKLLEIADILKTTPYYLLGVDKKEIDSNGKYWSKIKTIKEKAKNNIKNSCRLCWCY